MLTIRKAAFWTAKGGFSQANWRPFARWNTAFRKYITALDGRRNAAQHYFLTQNRKKSGCDLIFHLLTSNFAESRPDRQTA